MYFMKSGFGVILDNSTNGSICLWSTRLWLWAWTVISGRGQDKDGPGWRGRHSGEGMRKSGGFKEKSWRLERGRESMWGQKEEQRRLKGARRREKEHATSRKMGKGAAVCMSQKLPPVVLWDIKESDGWLLHGWGEYIEQKSLMLASRPRGWACLMSWMCLTKTSAAFLGTLTACYMQ